MSKSTFWQNTIFPGDLLDFSILSNTGMILPTGTTGERPTTPANGTLRYNTTISAIEVYDNSTWSSSLLGSGEANTVSNLGSGQPLFTNKVGADLQFRSIKAGTGISIATGPNELIISTSGTTSTFSSITVTGGGILNGTYLGNPIFSGNPAFTGAPDFSSVTNASTIRTDLGLDAAGIKTLYESNTNTNAYTDSEKALVAGITTGKRTVQITTAGPINIGGILPAGAIVNNVMVHVTSAYSAGTSIEVGDSVTVNSVMPLTKNDPETVGLYDTNPMTEFVAATQLIVTISGAPTTGAARIIVEYFM